MDWFILYGGICMSIMRMWDFIVYVLGFIDCDNISVWCMFIIFVFFVMKIEVLVLWMFNGFFDMCLNGFIVNYIKEKGGRYDMFLKLRLLCLKLSFFVLNKYVYMYFCIICFWVKFFVLDFSVGLFLMCCIIIVVLKSFLEFILYFVIDMFGYGFFRFCLWWGCCEVFYDCNFEGEIYVFGLVMLKVSVLWVFC